MDVKKVPCRGATKPNLISKRAYASGEMSYKWQIKIWKQTNQHLVAPSNAAKRKSKKRSIPIHCKWKNKKNMKLS